MTEAKDTQDLQAPHVKPSRYIMVAVVLAVVTGVEVFIATSGVLPRSVVTVVLIALTLTKAGLVMAFYMHLKYDTRWYRIVLIFPLFMVTVLMIIVLIAAASWTII